MTAQQVIVRVNGVPLLGRDLVAFGAKAGAEQTMSAEMFQFLQQRAIDRELALQAAKARGIVLDVSAQGQLASLRASAEAREVTDPEAVAFELRDAEAHLYVEAMLAKDGAPPAFAGQAEIDAYYQQHRAELGELPADPNAHEAAWAVMGLRIRGLLATEQPALHAASLATLLAQLRKAAEITDP